MKTTTVLGAAALVFLAATAKKGKAKNIHASTKYLNVQITPAAPQDHQTPDGASSGTPI
jgi:hypothetical protein